MLSSPSKREDRLLFLTGYTPEFSDRVGHFPAVRGMVAAVLSWLVLCAASVARWLRLARFTRARCRLRKHPA